MGIEVGEYVRYKDGTISKVLDINKDETFDLLCENFTLSSKFVVKHSKYPIDLIEEGDYVNGYRVVAIMEDMETGEIHLEMTSDYTNEIIGDCTIYNDDIKSIVTHEQYKNVEYKVEEDK